MTESSSAIWPVRSLRIMALVGAIAAVGGVIGASSFAVADYRPWLAVQAIAAGVVAATALAGLRTVAGARARGAGARAVIVTATAWSTACMAEITVVAAVPALGWVAGSPVQPWVATMSAACAAGLVVTTVGAGMSLRPTAVHAALTAETR